MSLWLFSLPLLISSFSLASGSFCRSSEKNERFPLPPPDHSLIPWVWDAMVDENLKRVEITVASRQICSFNVTRWQRVVQLFPRYSVTHFANGNYSNILVPYASMLDFSLNVTQYDHKKTWEKKVYQKNTFDRMIGEKLTCVYYDKKRKGEEVATSEALVIQGSSVFMSISVFQIICPVPKTILNVDEMKLQRHFVWDDATKMLLPRSSLKTLRKSLTVTLDTVRFPACRWSQLYQDLQLTRSNLSPKEDNSLHVSTGNQFPYLYNLSICTVTNRINLDETMEWIEYHRLVGVEHFFIYNTARGSMEHTMKRNLATYTTTGLITLIDWPYENCAINMSSGRFLHYRERNPWYRDEPYTEEGSFYNQQGTFQPPYCVGQNAGLASCYARYRKTSKYMMLIDDDEFIVIRPKNMSMDTMHRTKESSFFNVATTTAITKEYIQESWSLSFFADKYFAKHQKIGGLKFAPIMKGHCQLKKDQWVTIKEQGSSSQSGSLPRIGSWKHGRVGAPNEGKLFLRTALILSVTVHFFLQSEPGQKVQRQFYLMPYTEGALVHYKYPSSVVGDIYGNNLDVCVRFQHDGGFIEGIAMPLQGKSLQEYNAQNISTAPKHIRRFYEEWRVSADQTYPYLHHVHPIIKNALIQRIITMKKQISDPFGYHS